MTARRSCCSARSTSTPPSSPASSWTCPRSTQTASAHTAAPRAAASPAATPIHGPAAVAWSTWEAATTSLVLDDTHVSEFADPHYALAFARIENHYFVNHGFMAEGQLIRNAGRLAAIPTTIVQGRYDMCCPATSAYDLKQALPSADLRMVLAGHSAFEPLIASELVKVCDEYADL